MEHQGKDPEFKSVNVDFKSSLAERTFSFIAPEKSPYKGRNITGKYILSRGYPYAAPSVKLTVPMYHMNVSPDGYVFGLSKLLAWGECFSISDVIIDLKKLLVEPNQLCGEPVQVALYLTDRKEYDQHAAETN